MPNVHELGFRRFETCSGKDFGWIFIFIANNRFLIKINELFNEFFVSKGACGRRGFLESEQQPRQISHDDRFPVEEFFEAFPQRKGLDGNPNWSFCFEKGVYVKSFVHTIILEII
jgi:hypothetical protein